MAWRIIATRARGDGTEELLHPDLPAASCKVTDSLSSPFELEMTLRPEMTASIPMDTFSTCLYAEKDGVLRAGGIVVERNPKDDVLEVKATGHAGYLAGQPWVDSPVAKYDTDALDIVRLIWSKVQSHQRANVGLSLPTLASGVKVGKKTAAVKDKSGNVTTEAVDEPFLLASYETHDLGQVWHELLDESGIEYRERVSWSGERVAHSLEMARRVGARLATPRFEIGSNVMAIPEMASAASEYADEWLVLGAGEGSARINADRSNPKPPSRLRHIRVMSRASITRHDQADALALKLALLTSPGSTEIAAFSALDTADDPAWLASPGDEVRLTGDAGQAGWLDMWVRILSRSCDIIGKPDVVDFEVERVGKEETVNEQ